MVYSIRMRAAKGGPHEQGGSHISGAERLVSLESLSRISEEIFTTSITTQQRSSRFYQFTNWWDSWWLHRESPCSHGGYYRIRNNRGLSSVAPNYYNKHRSMNRRFKKAFIKLSQNTETIKWCLARQCYYWWGIPPNSTRVPYGCRIRCRHTPPFAILSLFFHPF